MWNNLNALFEFIFGKSYHNLNDLLLNFDFRFSHEQTLCHARISHLCQSFDISDISDISEDLESLDLE